MMPFIIGLIFLTAQPVYAKEIRLTIPDSEYPGVMRLACNYFHCQSDNQTARAKEVLDGMLSEKSFGVFNSIDDFGMKVVVE